MSEGILIVEDDMLVAEGLYDILSSYGYQAFYTNTEEETLKILNIQNINLVLLDINLGQESGYDICKSIRKIYDVPILFLTAYTGEMELVRGFGAGGDDYLTKPFRMQELLLRAQALIRRGQARRDNKIVSGDLTYDVNLHQMQKKRDILELTPIEQKLVCLLMQNYPQTMPRERLLYDIWDQSATYVEENTLNVNISRLREKLGTFEDVPYIVTVRGIGYRWNVLVRR